MKKNILLAVTLAIGVSVVQAQEIKPTQTEATVKVEKAKKKEVASEVVQEAPVVNETTVVNETVKDVAKEQVQDEVKTDAPKEVVSDAEVKPEVKEVDVIDPQTKADNEAIRSLFSSLADSVNSGDAEKFKSAVREQLIVITSDQEFLMGKNGVAEYFRKSLGENGVFERLQYTIDSGVTVEINKSGNWATVYGKGTEKYEFNGSDYDLPVRWTAVVIKEESGWKISSFHSGVNFANNPILTAFDELSTKAAIFGGIAGVLLGFILGLMIGRASKKS